MALILDRLGTNVYGAQSSVVYLLLGGLPTLGIIQYILGGGLKSEFTVFIHQIVAKVLSNLFIIKA